MSLPDKYINDFNTVVQLINNARNRAFLKVNEELINLYWNIGEIISKKVGRAHWGAGVVDALAKFINKKNPDIKGFNRRGLYRMKQFYETYKNYEKVTPLLTQIPWSHHLLIFSKTKSIEEKEFYIRLAMKEKYSKRELERQLNSSVFERTMLVNKIVSPVETQLPLMPKNIFKDTYIFEFLNLPKDYSENDLRKALILNLKDFILELGKGFSFIGEEYRVQVGKHDYYLDLLFYHRDLQCLVTFELKIEEFKPEFLGKMNFYLEALDREMKRRHENPSIGVLLCKGKDSEVVEFAMARNISPTLVADYETKLIDKKLLQKKLHELAEIFEQNIKEFD